MKTREETAQVTFNNNTSGIRLAQLNTIQHRAREGQFVETLYGTERDREDMQDTATFFEELGFEVELGREKCPDDGSISYELHIKWREGNEWASKIYRDVHADAVFYNFYLSDKGKLLRRIERRVSQESNCGNSSVEVAIDSDMDSDTVNYTKALLQSHPWKYKCLTRNDGSALIVGW